MRRTAGLLALVAVLAATPAQAYFERIEVGARGLALAGAYGAGARDVSAAYWNPAGLSLLDRPEGLFTYSKPFVVQDLDAGSVVAGLPVAGGGAAVTWHRMGLAGVVSENLIAFSYGRWVYKDDSRVVHLGGTLEAGVVSYDPGASHDDFGGASGPDYGSKSKLTGDLGVLWQEGSRASFAAVLRHLGKPEYDFVNGGGGSSMPGGLELSAAYQWRPESRIFFARSDVGARVTYNYSGEIWFYDVFAVRAGIFDEEFSGGIGVKSASWEVDAAFLTDKQLGNTYRGSFHVFLTGKGAGR